MMQLLSNLQLGAQIGNGHFGEVFCGVDEVHGEVAVKVLRQRPGETAAEWQARKNGLLHEGQRLKDATHTNVVRVIQLLEARTGDAIHLVMELCEGGSVQALCDKGPMPLATVRKLTTEVALGLQALHARGMVHRDIKPKNLLLDNRGICKLADFGLVTDQLIFGYAEQAGYKDHIAFEVWNGSGTSVRSDIWALGMTIYRLLHGAEFYVRCPVPRMTIRDGGFADSLIWLPHIPKPWRRVIRKMLHDDTQARYQNAGEVVNALAGLPIEPKWNCKTAPAETRWRRNSKGRRITVIWKMLGARNYEWEAQSEPIGAGRRRTLGKSSERLGYLASEKQLREFFSTQSSVS